MRQKSNGRDKIASHAKACANSQRGLAEHCHNDKIRITVAPGTVDRVVGGVAVVTGLTAQFVHGA